MFKYDTHVHTSESSRCGRVSARELVKLYKDADYSGIIITDHYCRSFLDSIHFPFKKKKSWDKKISRFLSGYKNALEEGNRIGLKVFLGIEILFDENRNDYLVYGIDENFLYQNPELYTLGLEKFRELISDQNILIFQAHPFRSYIEPVDPLLLDGVEVYNGNPRHNSNNHLAVQFAEQHNLRRLSGSDFHQYTDLARGGIETEYPLKSEADLVQLLELQKYKLMGDSYP